MSRARGNSFVEEFAVEKRIKVSNDDTDDSGSSTNGESEERLKKMADAIKVVLEVDYLLE